MKSILFLVIAAALAAGPVLAGDRADVESRMLDAARQGKEHISAALDDLKAGNNATGCAALNAARDDMNTVLELIDEDENLVRNDATASPAQRDEDLADIQTMKEVYTDMRNRMQIQLNARCA